MCVGGGTTPRKNPEFIYKKACFYSPTFKLQSPSMYPPFDAARLVRRVLPCSELFWTCQLWCVLVLVLFFGSLVSTSAKLFPLRIFFHPGKQKKSLGERSGDREGRAQGHAAFGQKLMNTQCHVGRCAGKSPIVKWANMLKESSEKFTEAKHSLSQQRRLVHWYRWVARTLS